MDDVVVLSSSSAGRHSCKVCRKGFRCGRSLGGHMRSHSLAEAEAVADDEDTDADDYEEERHERRAANGVIGSGGGAYGLRENPKKTRRLSGLDGGGDECHGDRGDHFSSCHPVLGHVRRQAQGGGYAGRVEVLSEREENEEEDLLIPTDPAVMMPAPRRRRRSMRVPAPAPSPAARDAFDTEPVDVALCLIMLSRDTPGRWGSPEKDMKRRDGVGYYHDNESDDASALFQYAGVEVAKSKKRKPGPGPAGGEKRGRYECPGCGRAFQSYQALGGHRASHKRINSSCCITKVAPDQPEPSVETNASFSTAWAPSSPDVDAADIANTAVVALKAKKVIKFECPICSKMFSSGQALGGHKRSHSIAGELYERSYADGDASIVEPEQSVIAGRILDLNLPAPGAEY